LVGPRPDPVSAHVEAGSTIPAPGPRRSSCSAHVHAGSTIPAAALEEIQLLGAYRRRVDDSGRGPATTLPEAHDGDAQSTDRAADGVADPTSVNIVDWESTGFAQQR
jgi:hypothetical protein